MAFDGKRIGGISVTLGLNSQKFVAGLSGAQRMMGSFQKSIGGVTARLGGLTTALAGAGLSVLIKQQFDAVDSMAKTADKLGITTEAMAGLQHAADLAGASNAALESGMLKMQRSIVDASVGVGTGVQALNKLGLTTQKLMGMSAEKQFGLIADRMNVLGSAAERTTVAMEIFGRGGTQLMNTLHGGSAGLMAAADEANKFGLAISRVDAASIEMANDAVTKMRDSFGGVARQLAVGLSPAITATAEATADWMSRSVVGTRPMIGGISVVATAFGKLVDVVDLLKLGFMRAQAFALDAFARMTEGALSANKGIVEILNTIPGVEVQTNTFLTSLSEEMRRVADESKEAFDKAWLKPPPSVGVNKFFDDLQKRAEENAAAIQAINQQRTAFSIGGIANMAGGRFAPQLNIVKDFASKALNQITTLQAHGPEMLIRKLGGFAGGPGAASSVAQRPALAFAESGSADSYRQQAAIRRQGEEIGKKQLKVQEQMRDELREIRKKPGPIAANLRG